MDLTSGKKNDPEFRQEIVNWYYRIQQARLEGMSLDDRRVVLGISNKEIIYMIVQMYQNDETNSQSKYSQQGNVKLKVGDELKVHFRIRKNPKVQHESQIKQQLISLLKLSFIDDYFDKLIFDNQALTNIADTIRLISTLTNDEFLSTDPRHLPDDNVMRFDSNSFKTTWQYFAEELEKKIRMEFRFRSKEGITIHRIANPQKESQFWHNCEQSKRLQIFQLCAKEFLEKSAEATFLVYFLQFKQQQQILLQTTLNTLVQSMMEKTGKMKETKISDLIDDMILPFEEISQIESLLLVLIPKFVGLKFREKLQDELKEELKQTEIIQEVKIKRKKRWQNKRQKEKTVIQNGEEEKNQQVQESHLNDTLSDTTNIQEQSKIEQITLNRLSNSDHKQEPKKNKKSRRQKRNTKLSLKNLGKSLNEIEFMSQLSEIHEHPEESHNITQSNHIQEHNEINSLSQVLKSNTTASTSEGEKTNVNVIEQLQSFQQNGETKQSGKHNPRIQPGKFRTNKLAQNEKTQNKNQVQNIPRKQNQQTTLMSDQETANYDIDPTIYNESKASAFQKLDKDIEFFTKQIQDNFEATLPFKQLVFSRVRKMVQYVYFKGFGINADIRLYGSCATGLALPDSDIDLSVLGFEDIHRNQVFYWMDILHQSLSQLRWITRSTTIYTTPIPVIKIEVDPRIPMVSSEDQSFQSEQNKMLNLCPQQIQQLNSIYTQPFKVDITFNQSQINMEHPGQITTEMALDWIKSNQNVRSLIILLKSLFKKKGLNQSYFGGLSSFSISLMVKAYLIYHEQQFKEECGVGELLIEMLNFYANQFDFHEQGISINKQNPFFYLGGSCPGVTIISPLTNKSISGSCQHMGLMVKEFKRVLAEFDELVSVYYDFNLTKTKKRIRKKNHQESFNSVFKNNFVESFLSQDTL